MTKPTLPEGLDLAELVARIIPPAVIFAEEPEHVADLRERATAALKPIFDRLLSELETARGERDAAQRLNSKLVLDGAALLDAAEDNISCLEQARHELAQAEANLSRALEALGPFAKGAAAFALDDEECQRWFKASDLRRASEVFTSLPGEKND